MADDWEDRAFESDEEDVKDRWGEGSGGSGNEKSKDAQKKTNATEKKTEKLKASEEDKTKEAEPKDAKLVGKPLPYAAGAGPGLRESIDDFDPTNKEQFEKLKDLLKQKVARYDSSQHYAGFLEGMLSTLCKNANLDLVKKLSDTLQAVSSEKAKQSKNAKAKGKKGKKVNLASGKDVDTLDSYRFTDDVYDEFEDYM